MNKIFNYCKKHSVLKRTLSETERKRKFNKFYCVYWWS